MPAATKKYFQDKVVLSLASLNIFLALLVIIVIGLRLGSNGGEAYIVQYRSSLGIGAFKTGSVLDFVYIIIFAVVAGAFHLFLSFKTYNLRRQLAVSILGMGCLLLLLALIVSNALLVLH